MLHRIASFAFAVLAIACGSPEPPAPDAPAQPPEVRSFAFMEGTWDVAGGDRAGRSTIARHLGVMWKEQWVGTRAGAPAELRTLLGQSDRVDAWVIARADGIDGTFDVLEGKFADGSGTFVSRSGSRPDGAFDRVTLTRITADAFDLVAERSSDGLAWVPNETLTYRRAADTTLPAPPASAPGCAAPEHRQFDFWAGSWSAGAGTNDLPLLLGGCLLEENWVSPSERGTSFNMYDHRTMQWTQVWMDTRLITLVLHGGLVGGDMRLTGAYRGHLERITWTPLAPDRVRQHGEASTNGGASWIEQYDLTYVPR